MKRSLHFRSLPAAAVLALACACGAKAVTHPDDYPGCDKATLESDLKTLGPLVGAGVDGGVLAPGSYIMSSTYLQLKSGTPAHDLFEQVMQPLQAQLPTQDGLVGVLQATSNSCLSARTLAVWKDVDAMSAFVATPNHLNAMSHVDDLSRGGSLVVHWSADETGATWARSIEELGASSQPTL